MLTRAANAATIYLTTEATGPGLSADQLAALAALLARLPAGAEIVAIRITPRDAAA